MDKQRGKIYNPDRAGQLKDFSGLRWDKITPTDVDGLVDFGDKLWVNMEFKYGDAPLPYGQRLAIERLCSDLAKTKPTLGIIARHTHPANEPIDCANAEVAEIWYDGKFTPPAGRYTVRTLTDAFRNNPKDMSKWQAPPTPNAIDWQYGVRCGIQGVQCRLCRGVVCEGSISWIDSSDEAA